mmetsp:Transcript_1171/g.1558  ORF Transcript_1171/g.1558 Transcript_1171/m.1558 type:complete len:85 (-) Transcript_1171:754-1008(-)
MYLGIKMGFQMFFCCNSSSKKKSKECRADDEYFDSVDMSNSQLSGNSKRSNLSFADSVHSAVEDSEIYYRIYADKAGLLDSEKM